MNLQFFRKPCPSVFLPFGLVLLALSIGVPIFLRMPPWCDLTLYDVSARTVLAGGVHYRDVFDTNLPGFVWCLIGIRAVLGNSVEVVRAIDLLVVAATTLVLMRFIRQAGANRAGQLWLAAAVAAFYPFTTQFSHCQRDVWMLLPMAIAVSQRARHLERGFSFRRSFLEGVIWGVAVWFKPHVVVVALIVWLSTRRGWADLRGNLAGGAAIGVLGILVLADTHTWKPFVEVFTKWNTSYYRQVVNEVPGAFSRFFLIFSTWSLLHIAGLVVAIRKVRSRDLRLKLLAVFYLAVIAQALVFQRDFEYVHIPEMFLLFALLAATLPRLLAWGVLAILASTALALAIGPQDHRLAWMWADYQRRCYVNRLQYWPDCFRNFETKAYRQRQKNLGTEREYFSNIDPVEIGEIADWLREQGVRDGEVLAWHDTPHAVYLELNNRPAFRFMHITTTVIGSDDNFWRMTIELRKRGLPPAKFIVSDVLFALRAAPPEVKDHWREAGPDLLPPVYPVALRASFPYDQPALYRSGDGHGRYIIHRLTKPVEHFEFEWDLWKKD